MYKKERGHKDNNLDVSCFSNVIVYTLEVSGIIPIKTIINYSISPHFIKEQSLLKLQTCVTCDMSPKNDK